MRFSVALIAITISTAGAAQINIDFDELPLDAAQLFYNGSDGAGGFASKGATFNNDFHPTFGSWRGWSYSRATDTTTPGFGNQYSAFPGSGAGGSEKYAVAFSSADGGEGSVVPELTLPLNWEPVALKIANTTYAALSMQRGDGFAKQFGGPSGNDPDWFRLCIAGLDSSHELIGMVEFYLADYRFSDAADDRIVDTWTKVDLSPLQSAGVSKLQFRLDSSDVGPFGLNTPAYFAMDDLLLARVDVAGDYDHNGSVDAHDYVAWRDTFGRSVAAPGDAADGDASGIVDSADYSLWRAGFGQISGSTSENSFHTAGALSQLAIPELPSAVLLLACLELFPIVFRYRSSCRFDNRRSDIS
jgi:hypothetical protein